MEEILLDLGDVFLEREEHEKTGLHLRLPNHPDVMREREETESAALQAAIEAESPSSDAYKDCPDTTPTSPRSEPSQES